MKTIELDSIKLLGNATEKNGIIQIDIPAEEEPKIRNSNARCHRLYGRLFEVSSIIFDGGTLQIFGQYTETPTTYFQEE